MPPDEQRGSTHRPSPGAPGPWFAWDRSAAIRGLTYAVPAAVVLPLDVPFGVALGVSVIPAAVVPLAPRRRGRVVVLVLGALMAVSVLVGSVLATTPWLAVPGLVVLSVGAAALAARHPPAMVLLVLGLPLVAVGFSYPGVYSAAPLALLFMAGAAYAWAVSLPWPDRSDPGPSRTRAAPGSGPSVGYGIRLGLAGAVCAAIGFALDFDHVGWAAAAAMLVMRPSSPALRLRALGRPVSVCVGAAAAIGIVAVSAPVGVLTTAVVLVVVAATAMATSRWYVTPAFTTFMVFLLLLGSDPAQAAARFGERLGETVLGVAIALLFGLLPLPALPSDRRLTAEPS